MRKRDAKIVIAFSQILLIAVAFFLINGLVAVILYLVSEISLAELADFLGMLGTDTGVAIIGYHIFRRTKETLSRLLNEQRDSEVVSESKIKELKKMLRSKG